MGDQKMNPHETPEISVLLVDDDKEEYVLAKRYLKDALIGTFKVEWASTCEMALNSIRDGDYDVCLFDYQLGSQTGIDLLNEIRTAGHDIPVIFLTGHGNLEVDIQAMEMGVFDYIDKKDLTPGLLERSIRYTIENHRARIALQMANEELEKKINERTAELQRSNQDLLQFANIVASDLQRPLHALVTQIEQLETEVAADYAVESQVDTSLTYDLLSSVHHEVDNMELLVKSVLDYSQVIEKNISFETVDLSYLVKNLRTHLDSEIRKSSATIDIKQLPEVHGDPQLLRGLFENLIDNAIKFSGEDPPKILISSEQKGKDWLCAVSDKGIGIYDEDQEDIFLMFHRGSQETDQPGIGIGLAMCRKIIQYHGGRIWVDSEPNQGSTFYFTLPVT